MKSSSSISVSITTALRLGQPAISKATARDFSPRCPDWLCSLPKLLFNRTSVLYRHQNGRGVMLTTHPYLALRLRISGAVPPLHQMLSWRAQRQFYFRQIMEPLTVKLYPLFCYVSQKETFNAYSTAAVHLQRSIQVFY